MTPEALSHPKARAAARIALAAVYAGIGVVHVRSPDAFLPIMPDWVPDPRDVVLATGACELAGSVALLTPRLRRAAGWAFAAYAVCVFPANIKHALDNVNVPPIPSSWWYHGPRLAFQPVFVWWALWAAGVVDWPFGGGGRPGRIGSRTCVGSGVPACRDEGIQVCGSPTQTTRARTRTMPRIPPRRGS